MGTEKDITHPLLLGQLTGPVVVPFGQGWEDSEISGTIYGGDHLAAWETISKTDEGCAHVGRSRGGSDAQLQTRPMFWARCLMLRLRRPYPHSRADWESCRAIGLAASELLQALLV